MALKVAEKGRGGEPDKTTVDANGNVVQQSTAQQQVVQQPVAETKPKYRFGWDKEGATFGSVIRGEAKDVPIEHVLPDYLRYVQDNNIPEDYISLYTTMKDRDISKSYAQNEKEKKNKQMADMWEGIGNVLVSFANFGGALAGAPEPTNLKDPAELTARQKRLRDETLAQRNAYNKNLFAMMAQQKADEYKRENLRIMEEYKKALAEANQQKADANSRVADSRVGVNNATEEKIRTLTPEQQRVYQTQAKKNQQQGYAAATRANKAKDYNSGNTNSAPPSRRSQNTNNVPPSRRK